MSTSAFLLLALLAGAGDALSAREIDQRVARFFAAERGERAAIERELDQLPPLTKRQADEWKSRLLKLAAKGPRAEWKGTSYLYDEKAKRGKYLVTSKSGRALVLGLHGGGAGSGDAGSAASAFGGALGKHDCVAIFPEVLRKTEHGWGEDDTERFVLELIEAVKRSSKVDTNRIYLTGHSMGGYGTWTIGAHHADVFAGLAAFAGAPTPVYDRGDTGQREVVAIESGVLPSLQNLPIFVYQSLDDPRVPPAANVFAAAELERLQRERGGYVHLYQQVDGRGHDFPDGGPGQGLAWALDHVRDPRPKALTWQPHRAWKRMFYWLWWEEPAIGQTLCAKVAARNEIAIDSPLEPRGLALLLDERLVDLEQPVTVTVNGERKFHGIPERRLSTLLRTAAERNDAELLFPARIDL